MESVQDRRFELVIQGVDSLPRRLQIESAVHHLDAQMIFLVDHHAVLLTGVNRDGTRAVRVGNLTTDQLAFDQELAIDFRQRLDVDVTNLFPVFDRIHFGAHGAFDADPVFVAAAANEREIGKVTGETNSAADHDVRLGAGSAEPFARLMCQVAEVRVAYHSWLVSLPALRESRLPLSSIRRNSSRISEARS